MCQVPTKEGKKGLGGGQEWSADLTWTSKHVKHTYQITEVAGEFSPIYMVRFFNYEENPDTPGFDIGGTLTLKKAKRLAAIDHNRRAHWLLWVADKLKWPFLAVLLLAGANEVAD